jgi:hypothetical protein
MPLSTRFRKELEGIDTLTFAQKMLWLLYGIGVRRLSAALRKRKASFAPLSLDTGCILPHPAVI